MHPEPIKKLIEFFMGLPGIGPRQASRFAYSLIDKDEAAIGSAIAALGELSASVARCEDCFRSMEKKSDNKLCGTCAGGVKSVIVVEKDQDLEALNKSGLWNGGYHVLGGTISLLNEQSLVTERMKKLYERVERISKENPPVEVVLATSATTEGDATALYAERILEPFVNSKKITLTRLGRGISTGTELEYADSQTIKNALKNRK